MTDPHPQAHEAPVFTTRKRPSSAPYIGATMLMGMAVLAAWLGQGRYAHVEAGSRAPDFAATSLEGEVVALSDFEGEVVLVNIWATWCLPCRGEMPSMEALYREFEGTGFEGTGFEILAVSVDAAFGSSDAAGRAGVSAEALAAFADELGLSFPILHDPEGDIERLYMTTGVPVSFLVGRDGVIVRRIAGATVWDHPTYRDLIQRLLST